MAKMRRQKGTRRTFKLTLQALVQRLSSLSLLKNSPSRGEGMHIWTISCKETMSSVGFEGWEAGAKKNKKNLERQRCFWRTKDGEKKTLSTRPEARFDTYRSCVRGRKAQEQARRGRGWHGLIF